MQAILVPEPGGPEQLVPGQADEPVTGPGEVLIDVHAIGLNRADCLQRRGLYPAPPGTSPLLGLEVSGEVLETGPGDNRYAPGDRVFALLSGGGYAERVAVHADFVLPMPGGLSFAECAGIAEVFATAWHALFHLGKLCAGETLLQHAGASGVGTAAIQLARRADAAVLVTAGSAEKIARCVSLGARAGCNYHETDFKEFVGAETDGQGVDVLIDVVGAAYFERNIDCLAADGRMVLLGLQGGHTVEQVRLAKWLQKRLSLHAHTLRNRDAVKRVVLREIERNALDDFASGVLVPVIDRVFPWQEAAAAHRYMESNANIGKIILEVTA